MSFLKRRTKGELHQPAHRPAQTVGAGRDQTNIVSGTMDTQPWEPVSRLPYPGQDLALLGGGSICQTGPHFLNAVHVQGLANSNLATATLGLTTPTDGQVIQDRLWTPGGSVELSCREGADTLIEVHPGRALLVSGVWQTLGNWGGCGSEPEFCVNLMQTDPLALESLDDLVKKTIAELRRHNLTGGCSVLELIGAGGSLPVGEYLVKKFAQEMEVNRRHRVLYLGSPRQFQNRRIARAWLSQYLAQPIPPNTLLYIVSLERPGPQVWDLALAHGLLSITSTDRYFGQADAANNHRKLKEHGDVVEVTAHVVPVPLRQLERRSRFGRKQTNFVLQDSPVPALLSALKRRIAAVHYRYRYVVFAGDFHGEEIEQLRQHAQMLAPKGQIEILVNRMSPVTHNHRTADYYFVEFGIPEGQAASLVELARDESPYLNGSANIGREELAAQLAQGGTTNGISISDAVHSLVESRR